MKYVKSLVALVFAAFLCATASASLCVNGDKQRVATLVVPVGGTASVTLINDTSNKSYAPVFLVTNKVLQTMELVKTAKTENFTVTLPESILASSTTNITFHGIAPTPTDEPYQLLIKKNNTTNLDNDTPVTIWVTVENPKVTFFNGGSVTTVGAAISAEDTTGDLVLEFSQGGAFSLSRPESAEGVLAVGGGGMGAAGGNNTYGGSGGGGLGAMLTKQMLKAGDYQIVIGPGGSREGGYGILDVTVNGSGATNKTALTVKENDSPAGSTMLTYTDATTVTTKLTASGGTAGTGTSTDGTPGTGGTNETISITGKAVLYGANAPAGRGATPGIAGNPNTGAGAVGNTGSGSARVKGGNGVVIVRLVKKTPASVEVNQPLTYSGLEQTGVVENVGYTLTGDWYATNASNAWEAVATLKDGYYWENGSSEKATNITWAIDRAPVTVSAVDTNKVYGTDDPVLPVTVVGTNGLDGIDIAYKIARGDQECVGDYAGTIVVTIEKQIQGNEEGYGNYDVTAGANATFTIKPADPFKAAVESGAITASVDKAWLDRNVFLETTLTPAEMRAKLTETSDGDTLKMWQKYALGMDTNEAFLADAPQNKDAANVTIVAKANTSKYTSDIKVQFRVNEGTLQDGVAVDVPVGGTDDPSGNYTMKALFTQEGASYSGDAQPVRNKIGILRKAAYRESGSARELLAVPWTAAMDKDSAVLVSNVVKTACLTQGDKLYVYDTATGNYNGWVLTEENCWQPLSKQIKVSGGRVTPVTESESAADPATATIARGNGIWLEREAATTPVVFVGGADAAAVTLTPATGMNLMSLDGIGELDIKTKFTPHEGDRVIVPTGDVPAIYTYKDGAWGYDKETVTTTTGGKKRIKVERTTEGEMKVGKGAGFWYDRQSAPPL